MGCIAIKPAVSELEKNWTRGILLQLEMQEAGPRAFGRSVGFVNTPSFMLFGADGRLLRRWDRGVPALSELP